MDNSKLIMGRKSPGERKFVWGALGHPSGTEMLEGQGGCDHQRTGRATDTERARLCLYRDSRTETQMPSKLSCLPWVPSFNIFFFFLPKWEIYFTLFESPSFCVVSHGKPNLILYYTWKIISFNHPSNPSRCVVSLPLLYRGANGDTKRLSYLPRVT